MTLDVPQPIIPGREFYESNKLLPGEIPKKLRERLAVSISDSPPNHINQETIEKYGSPLITEYADIDLGDARWTYLIMKYEYEHPVTHEQISQKQIHDIVITTSGKPTSLQELARIRGITNLTMMAVDPDTEGREEYLAASFDDPTSARLWIPIPREKQDVLAVVHELAHPILELKLIDSRDQRVDEYYIGEEMLSERKNWSTMFTALVNRARELENPIDKQIVVDAFNRLQDSFLKTKLWESIRLSLAKWEYDTWFIAVQEAHNLGLSKFMQENSKDIPTLINYYALTTRLTDHKDSQAQELPRDKSSSWVREIVDPHKTLPEVNLIIPEGTRAGSGSLINTEYRVMHGGKDVGYVRVTDNSRKKESWIESINIKPEYRSDSVSKKGFGLSTYLSVIEMSLSIGHVFRTHEWSQTPASKHIWDILTEKGVAIAISPFQPDDHDRYLGHYEVRTRSDQDNISK